MKHLRLYEEYNNQGTELKFGHPGFLRDPKEIKQWFLKYASFGVDIPVEVCVNLACDIRDNGEVYINVWDVYDEYVKTLWVEDKESGFTDLDLFDYHTQYHESDSLVYDHILISLSVKNYIPVNIVEIIGSLELSVQTNKQIYDLKGAGYVEGGDMMVSDNDQPITHIPENVGSDNGIVVNDVLILEKANDVFINNNSTHPFKPLFELPEEERYAQFIIRVQELYPDEEDIIVGNLKVERPDLFEKYFSNDYYGVKDRVLKAQKHKDIIDL